MTPTPKGAEARAEILEAAWKLFITKGYASTSLRDIAAAAGNRAVGGIYNHFASKELLFQNYSVWPRRWQRCAPSSPRARGIPPRS